MKIIIYFMAFSLFLNAQIISFNGLDYKTVKSPITGKVWLDRNIGAKRACQSFSDKLCYGDYFQWGRKSNGHEKIINKNNSKNRLDSDLDNGGKYIIVKHNPSSFDWRVEQNDNLWKGKNPINNVCPKGFTIPTLKQLENETVNATKQFKVKNSKSAFKSFLKIPASGFRNLCAGDITRASRNGSLWTGTPYERESYYLDFNNQEAVMSTGARAEALPVRCIKN